MTTTNTDEPTALVVDTDNTQGARDPPPQLQGGGTHGGGDHLSLDATAMATATINANQGGMSSNLSVRLGFPHHRGYSRSDWLCRDLGKILGI